MIDKKLVEAFVQECIQEQKWKDRYKSNHIEMDDFFTYSGETEELNEDFKAFLSEMDASKIKVKKLPVKSRKEYFRKYWQEYKLNLI